MDSIIIRDLEFQTRIGVPEEERSKPQLVLVTVELHGDLSPIGTTDDISHGIDYDKVVKDVFSLAGTERKTIERLAEDIAALILRKYRPDSVKVSVFKKPLPGMNGVTVTIERP